MDHECVNEFTPDVNAAWIPSMSSNGQWKPLTKYAARYGARLTIKPCSLPKRIPERKGVPRQTMQSLRLRAARAKAEEIKNSAYALGKAPEHLTENQQTKVAMIAENNNRLYRAYRMKETLRLLLKIKDVDEAASRTETLARWASTEDRCFKKLYLRSNVTGFTLLNTIRLG